MREAVVIAVLSAVAVGLLTWLASLFRNRHDRRKVYEWLRTNTKDYPGESHVDTATVAKGTGLPDERVRRACMSDKRIYRTDKRIQGTPAELWSVWRAEEQSIYEIRGFLST